MVYKTKIGKEDFKRAYTECYKESWIFHSKENFEIAVKLLKDKKFQFNVDAELNDVDEFNDDASSIDVFQTFLEMFEDNNDQEAMERWNKAWEAEDGFDFESYAGDSIEDGNAVGSLAREYFDWMIVDSRLKGSSVNFSAYNFNEGLAKTRDFLNDENLFGTYYLYEPAFEFDNLNFKTRCDILEFNFETKKVKIYEVKGTSKVKKEHFFDLVYQAYVLEKNGFEVEDIFIVHMDPLYVYGIENRDVDMKEEGKKLELETANLKYEEVLKDIEENNLLEPFKNEPEIDVPLNKIFVIDDLTYGESQKRETLMECYLKLKEKHPIDLLMKQLETLFLHNEENIDEVFKYDKCLSKMSYTKKDGWYYGNYVKSDEPYCYHVMDWYDKNIENVFNFMGMKKSDKARIYLTTQKVYLKDFENENEFPIKLTSKGEVKETLSQANKKHFEVYKEYLKKGTFNNEDIISEDMLNEVKYILSEYENQNNIYMYDFETVKWAIPHFYLSKTYQQIPFQYSIDVIYDDNYDYNKPKTMHHYDFIENKRIDPRPKFIINFIKDIILRHGKGVYVAYNKSFEKSVLKYLSIQFPKYKKPLMYVANNTIDLMDFFKGNSKEDRPNFVVYHPNFHGSYSIKKTQPALDPKFNYNDLKINKGDKASQTFREFMEEKIPDEAWKEIEPWMIKYCNRDTLAMVVILKKIEEAYKERIGGKLNG